jgi:hypothetical protein
MCGQLAETLNQASEHTDAVTDRLGSTIDAARKDRSALVGWLVKDPFTWFLEGRRQLIGDRTWFSLGFLVCGVSVLLTHDDPFNLIVSDALGLTLIAAAVIMLIPAIRRGWRSPHQPHYPPQDQERP